MGFSFGQAFLVETIGTWILCLSVLHSATCDNKNQNNSYYGLTIGFSVVMSAYAFGWVSGGAFNPAVGLLPIYASCGAMSCTAANPAPSSSDISKWVGCYWSAPFLGALLSVASFLLFNEDESIEFMSNPDKVFKPAQEGHADLAQGKADSEPLMKKESGEAGPNIEMSGVAGIPPDAKADSRPEDGATGE